MGIEQHIQQIMKEQAALRKELDELARRVVLAPFNAGATKELTISGGAIAATRPHMTVLPESGTADNLDSITNFADGKFIVVSTAQDGDIITVRDILNTGGNGNIDLRGTGNNRALSTPHDSLFLYYKESTGHWEQVGPELVTGDWTPAVAFGGSSSGITYAVQDGTYTRIGNTVWLFCDIAVNDNGSATGDATITGLPFSPASDPDFVCDIVSSSLGTNWVQVQGRISGSSTIAIIGRTAASASPAALTENDIVGGSTLQFTMVYQV